MCRLEENIMMAKKIEMNLVNDVAASYKKLMAVCEEAEHAGAIIATIIGWMELK